jgi:hypothetical protein
MNVMKWVCTVAVLGSIMMGCQYYEDYRMKKGTADVREETAEMMRAYRVCLQRYEGEPPKAKEHCAPYTQSLREVEIRREIVR